jgi:hypothetical protein
VSSTATSRSTSEGSSSSRGHGHSDPGGSLLPSRTSFSRNVQASDSWSTGESDSVSTGINSSTAWGLTTSKAIGDSESLARGMQRSREFLVEQHELQQLPASAMIISYAGPGGRQVVMADANPGLAGLSTATQRTLEESGGELGRIAAAVAVNPLPPQAPDEVADRVAGQVRGKGPAGSAEPVSWRSGDDQPSPNLGPPPPRLDWRKRRS